MRHFIVTAMVVALAWGAVAYVGATIVVGLLHPFVDFAAPWQIARNFACAAAVVIGGAYLWIGARR